MDLKQLGWKDLDAARRARQGDSFATLREMGKDLYEMIQTARTPETPTTAVDPLAGYDLGTVLNLGIAAWSYEDGVSPFTIAQLDPETAEWAARLIVGTKESEADRKNG